MRKNDKLHLLIHRLSMNEKRYFKLSCNKYRHNKKYILLFDQIDNQKVHDEERVKNSLGTKHSRIGNFASTKNYLFNLILKSLIDYNHKNDKEQRLRSQVNYATILLKKNLFSQALEIIVKVKKEAKDMQYYQVHISAITLLHTIYINIPYHRSHTDIIKKSVAEKDDALKKYMNMEIQKSAAPEITLLYKLQKGKQVGRELVLKGEKQFFSLKPDNSYSRLYYYQNKIFFYLTVPDHAKVSRACLDLIKLLDADPIFKKRDKRFYEQTYITTLLNLMIAYQDAKEYRKELEIINLCKSKCRMFKRTNVVSYAHLCTILQELNCYLSSGDLDAAIDHSKEVLTAIKDPVFQIYEHNLMEGLSFLVTLYIRVGDYKNALMIVNDYLNNYNYKNFLSFPYWLKFAEIIALLELGKQEAVEYKINSIIYFLKENKLYDAFEKLVLKTIGRMSYDMLSKAEEKVLLQQMEDLSKAGKNEHTVVPRTKIIQWFKER